MALQFYCDAGSLSGVTDAATLHDAESAQADTRAYEAFIHHIIHRVLWIVGVSPGWRAQRTTASQCEGGGMALALNMPP